MEKREQVPSAMHPQSAPSAATAAEVVPPQGDEVTTSAAAAAASSLSSDTAAPLGEMPTAAEEAQSSLLDAGGDVQPDSPSRAGQVPFARTSKYDFVKVRIWQQGGTTHPGDGGGETLASDNHSSGDPTATGGHYHVLSRYLVSRSLTAALVPRAQARRISLQCKKRLVDAGRLDVTQEEWTRTLEQVVREEEEATTAAAAAAGSGVGVALPATASPAARAPAPSINMERFKMIQWFQSRRTPLLVFLYGTALIGTSALATKLCSRLDFSQVLQSENAYQVGGGDGTDDWKDGDDRQHRLPLYLLPFSCEADLEAEYARRCRRVRRALQSDVTKLLAEGRSVILEGSLVDPTLFADLLPGAAEDQPTTATPTAATSSTNSGRAPILISFHVHLPATKHRLLLHNHFAATLNLHSAEAAPVHIVPLPATHSATTLDSFGASPASSSSSLGSLDPASAAALGSPLLPIAALPTAVALGPPSPPPSPALIWRNLRWLESIVARRHQQWSDLIRNRSAAHAELAATEAPAHSPFPEVAPTPSPTASSSALASASVSVSSVASLTYSVSLDPLLGAVDSMHATVLQAMQRHHSEHDQP